MNNRSNPANASNNENLEASANPQQYDANGLAKSWLQKLLVIVLCAMSFYAGWQAHHSSQARKCLESGGQIVTENEVVGCQW